MSLRVEHLIFVYIVTNFVSTVQLALSHTSISSTSSSNQRACTCEVGAGSLKESTLCDAFAHDGAYCLLFL